MIRKIGNKYIVTNKTGSKILGKHKTKLEAIRQLQAIEINKHIRGK